MKRILPILPFILVLCAEASGQSVINSAGNTYKDGNAEYEWSIGELALVNEMQSAGQVILTNGFLQAFPLIAPAPGNKDTLTTPPFTGKQIVILPNPTKGKLQVNFSFAEVGKLKLAMVDEFGFTVYKKEIYKSAASQSEIINMETFANGVYFLVVDLSPSNFVSQKKKQTFRIIKIH